MMHHSTRAGAMQQQCERRPFRMNSLIARLGAILAALLMAMTLACGGEPDRGSDYGVAVAEPGQPLLVGVSVALTGDSSGDARRIEQGVRLAVEERGAIEGHSVQVETRDDRCNAEGSREVAEAFAAVGNLVGVIGPMCSRGCVPASLVYDEAKLTMITPSCTASVLNNQGLDTIFRMAWNDELGAVGAARFATGELKTRRVYAVNDGTFYGKTQRDAFKVTLEDRGGDLIANESIDAQEWDFTALVAEIKAARPELIFFGGFLPAGRFLLQQLRYAGVSVPFMAGDVFLDSSGFIGESNGAADGAYIGEARGVEGSSYAPFGRRYRERWGEEPGPYSAQGYDAAVILLRAAARTANGKAGAVTIDRKALRDEILDTDTKGTTGRIRFFPNGERNGSAQAVIVQVKDGRFETVKEFKAEK